MEGSSLDKINRLYNKKGMIVLAISIDQGEYNKVKNLVNVYVKQNNLTFLHLLDPKRITFHQYHLFGIPTTYLINHKGKIVTYAIGPIKWDSNTVQRMFDLLLSDAT